MNQPAQSISQPVARSADAPSSGARDGLTRFSGRADDYARYRPGYPAELIDVFLQGLDRSRCVVADMGAGTGISSVAIAGQLQGSAKVIAVEPNEAMLAKAVANARVEYVCARAEQSGLSDASVDAVGCFQAFHWLEPARSLDEFARISRPGCQVGFVWNDRDDREPATAALSRVLALHNADPRARFACDAHRPLVESSLFERYSLHEYLSQRCMTETELLGWTQSMSTTPQGGCALERFAADIKGVFAGHSQNGRITIAMSAHLHLAFRL